MRLAVIDNVKKTLSIYENKVVLAVYEFEEPPTPEVVEEARTYDYQTRA
jgi:hypothetical protein